MTSSPRRTHAFSLIEVTLSIAILGLMVLGFMGLLNRGFRTLSEANNRSVEQRIATQLFAEVQQEPWDALDATYASSESTTRYFDGQGLPIPLSAPLHVYTARIDLESSTSGSVAPLKLPGDFLGRVTRSDAARTVVVRITDRAGPGGIETLKDPGNPSVRRYSGTIIKLSSEAEQKGSGPG